METTKCLNEWNATLEALGQGKQTILIRKYGAKYNQLLLYPTITYAKNKNLLDSFKDNYKNFVEDNLLPIGENKVFEIKYYAKVEEVINKPSSGIDAFNNFHIWTKKHVKMYLGRKIPKIWVLRVYKLNKPQMLKKTRGMRYANVNTPVKLEGKPVIPDDEFNKLKEEILNIK